MRGPDPGGQRGREVSTAADALAPMRTRPYLVLLVMAAVLGVPVSAGAYWFLKLIALIQHWVFGQLPAALGLAGVPAWWPLLPLAAAGLIVGLAIRYLPGRGGHSPADGFSPGAVLVRSADLPGIGLAALASLSLGVVLGPEAPLVALGGGLAVLAVRLARRDLPSQTAAVVAAVGSFAAISALLGSPLAGAFMLMEASGLGGAAATLVLVPGLLGAGLGYLVFVGLGSLTGYGTFSLAVGVLPPFGHPQAGEFGWALVIGVAAAFAARGIRWLALTVRTPVAGRPVLLTPAVGLVIAGLAAGYALATGKPVADVLFSGQDELGPLIQHSGSYAAWALVLLVACKGLAYASALSSFRGGPIFPAIFLGAAAGLALAHLPGLPPIPGAAIGIGAMTAAMLRLPLTAVLLTTLLLGADGVTAMPMVIVGVVVSYVLTIRLAGPPRAAAAAGQAADPAAVPAAAR